MQQGEKRLLHFLGDWGITTLAVAVTATVLRPHINYGHWEDLLMASLILGLLNAFVRPILLFLALPLVFFTLGLFRLVINALILYFVGIIMHPHFEVDTFGYAFLGALIISVVSIALNILTGNWRMNVRRQPPRNKKSDDDVIDV